MQITKKIGLFFTNLVPHNSKNPKTKESTTGWVGHAYKRIVSIARLWKLVQNPSNILFIVTE